MGLLPGQTIDDLKTQEKVLIQQQILGAVKTLGFSTTQIFNKVWKNDAGLTPQQVFDSFGVDSAALHGMLATIQNLVDSVAPGTLDLSEPKAVTITVGA